MKKLLFVLVLLNFTFCQDLELYKKASKIEEKKKKNKSYEKIRHSFFQKYINKIADEETNKNIEEIILSSFGIYPYKPNYLLFGTYDYEQYDDDRSNFETIFQISAKKPIFYDLFHLEEIISIAYTQKSFWQTSRDSSPFRETNYAPEFFMEIPYKNSKYLKGYKLSLIHESNGRNEQYSRSWNRIYFEGFFQFSNFFAIPKVWYRIPEKKDDDDNPNIYKYYGYGELRLIYPYKNQDFDLTLRNNLKLNSSNKGSAQLNWTFPLPSLKHFTRSYGFLQIFIGYGNSLIDYNHETNKIGFGIALSR